MKLATIYRCRLFKKSSLWINKVAFLGDKLQLEELTSKYDTASAADLPYTKLSRNIRMV